MVSPVYERAVSAFPFSVGTSLGLESLFDGPNEPIDPDRKIPQKVEITDYSELWINISTLFRNLFTAIPRDRISDTRPRDCRDALLMEMLQIQELIKEQSGDKTKVVYYYCTYAGLDRELKGITRRKANTSKQKFYEDTHNETIKLLLRQLKETNSLHVREFDTFLRPRERTKALFITHYSVDLLNKDRFRVMDLLESHTGVLKHYNTWYTKYYNGRDLNMLPFNSFLLKVFGDNELISPYHFKVRRLILEVAMDHKWNYSTTMIKIHNDISKIKDHFARIELIKLM